MKIRFAAWGANTLVTAVEILGGRISFAFIGATIISSSFISGLFGMAGGMILVCVLLVYFDVATGMVIFSIIQFVANGWRAMLWWRFVLWRIFFVYVAGAVIS